MMIMQKPKMMIMEKTMMNEIIFLNYKLKEEDTDA